MSNHSGKCPHCGAPYYRQPGDAHGQGPIEYTCNCERGWNMAGHTNNAASNESWEIQQMRVDSEILRNRLNPPETTYVSSDIPAYRTCVIMGVGESVEPCAVQKERDELKSEVERIRTACIEQNFTICQTLGEALGYREADGSVNVCDHTAETLADEAAQKLTHLIHQHDEMAGKIVAADLAGMKYKEEAERLKAELTSYNIMGDVSEAIGFLKTSLKDDVSLSGAFAQVHGWMKAIRKAWQEEKSELAACRASDAFVDSLRADKLKLADEVKRLEHKLAVRERTIELLRDDENGKYCWTVERCEEQARAELAKPGVPITRNEALDVARDIIERCEKERTESAEAEAEKGVQYEPQPETKPTPDRKCETCKYRGWSHDIQPCATCYDVMMRPPYPVPPNWEAQAMNTIHMRFIGKNNEIIGYGIIRQDTEIPVAAFMVSVDGVAWEYKSASTRSYRPPERGIEVRDEVWYEGDILSFIWLNGQELTGVLAWSEEKMTFVVVVKVGCLDPTPFYMDEVKNPKRIGNIHEGEKA